MTARSTKPSGILSNSNYQNSLSTAKSMGGGATSSWRNKPINLQIQTSLTDTKISTLGASALAANNKPSPANPITFGQTPKNGLVFDGRKRKGPGVVQSARNVTCPGIKERKFCFSSTAIDVESAKSKNKSQLT